MTTPYPPNVDIASTTIGGLQSSAVSRDQSWMANDYQFTEIGLRVEAIRAGFSDLSQRAWAERHGFNPTQYNNWERGARRIPLEASEKLCKLYGVTLDFIYLGRRDGLSETASKSV